jgi:hypothetical protein
MFWTTRGLAPKAFPLRRQTSRAVVFVGINGRWVNVGQIGSQLVETGLPSGRHPAPDSFRRA